ncbi:FERM and PDZ domain-containing protein 4-like protein, partial [Leptotrombidium deliense]
MDCWYSSDPGLPYGWEIAVDKKGKPYYINHVNKTTTYENPRKDDDEAPPQPREVELFRHPELGFGFVAGSEKPVIVRFVKEGGPSEEKLQSGDQILKINGEDVFNAKREHVIDLVKSCKNSVVLIVCQPHSNNSTRKSALLTASKKAKLKSNPSRVRFAEGVVINGSPLYCPSPFESCVPFIPNVLKVFLENGQTKTFKYDSSTTVQDVMNSLLEKLSIKSSQYFSLCVEHIKSMRRNKLILLDPKDTLQKIAARPGAHNLRCLFRIAFVPKDAFELFEKDATSFEYLYVQCCNDVVHERFSPELKYEIALRLSALHLFQHAISNGMLSSGGKVNLKAIEKECGLEPFIPHSLLDTMKRKELHKILNHFLKQNQQLCPPGQKSLTALQAKMHYLKVISELPSYGSKMFPTNIRDSSIESALLVSPKYGISHVTSLRHSLPISLAKIEDVSSVLVTKDDELCYTVEIQLKGSNSPPLHFGLEDKDAEEFALILQGYHRLFSDCNNDEYDPIPILWDVGESWWTDSAPTYNGQHLVKIAPWSYLSPNAGKLRKIDFGVPPPPYSP